jgi:hypothetical protein
MRREMKKRLGHGQKLLIKVKLPLSLIKHQAMTIHEVAEVEFQAAEGLLNTEIQGYILSYPHKFAYNLYIYRVNSGRMAFTHESPQ